MRPLEQLYRLWFAKVNPLVKIQLRSTPFPSIAHTREVMKGIEDAYRAGWEDCAGELAGKTEVI